MFQEFLKKYIFDNNVKSNISSPTWHRNFYSPIAQLPFYTLDKFWRLNFIHLEHVLLQDNKKGHKISGAPSQETGAAVLKEGREGKGLLGSW